MSLSKAESCTAPQYSDDNDCESVAFSLVRGPFLSFLYCQYCDHHFTSSRCGFFELSQRVSVSSASLVVWNISPTATRHHHLNLSTAANSITSNFSGKTINTTSKNMSTIITPSPKGKGAATNDADSIMPLLFATIGNPSISFPKMAAMDAEGRSASALEHKFRKWRQKGREIAEANPDHAGEMGKAATPKKRAPAAKKNANANGKTKAKQADVGDEEDKTVDYAEAVDITKEEEGMVIDTPYDIVSIANEK